MLYFREGIWWLVDLVKREQPSRCSVMLPCEGRFLDWELGDVCQR